MAFKSGDYVFYHGCVCRVSSSDGKGEIYIDGGFGRVDEDKVKLMKKYSIDILGYDCTYLYAESKLIVQFREYKFETTFYGDVEDFLNSNKNMISQFFASKMDIEVKAILNEFTSNFDNTISKLKNVVLPHTKDLLLSEVIDVFKKNITKVADLFSDKSIKNSLLNLFK